MLKILLTAFHPGVKRCFFQPGLKHSCNPNYFHPGAKFHPGVKFTPLACNRGLRKVMTENSCTRSKSSSSRPYTGKLGIKILITCGLRERSLLPLIRCPAMVIPLRFKYRQSASCLNNKLYCALKRVSLATTYSSSTSSTLRLKRSATASIITVSEG